MYVVRSPNKKAWEAGNPSVTSDDHRFGIQVMYSVSLFVLALRLV